MKLLLKLSDMLDFEPSYTATKRATVPRCRSYKDAKHKEWSVRREHSLSIEVFKEGNRDGNSFCCVLGRVLLEVWAHFFLARTTNANCPTQHTIYY
jgi:hypothetical protein